jgi:hypothetical protein
MHVAIPSTREPPLSVSNVAAKAAIAGTLENLHH